MKAEQPWSERKLVVHIWHHWCPTHGEHVVVFGSDSELHDDNARRLWEDCAEACEWCREPKRYEYDISSLWDGRLKRDLN